ncbi:hypothetical protein Tco_1129474 [Tanacetum coccineum]
MNMSSNIKTLDRDIKTTISMMGGAVAKKDAQNLECIFTVICNIVKKPESVDESLEISKLLSETIAQQPNEKHALRLKILLNLYNMLENSYRRFLVYMKALEEQKSSAKENFKFLTKFLATFSGEDADRMDEAKEQAAYTIIEFVKASDMFHVYIEFYSGTNIMLS